MENQDDILLGGKVIHTGHYKADLSRPDINILYSMMLLRISKGYLTEETSFLMGMGSDIIGRLEKLVRKRMTAGILLGMVAGLGEQSFAGLIVFSSDLKGGYFPCHMVRTKRKKIIEHALYVMDSIGTERLAFKLFEQNPNFIEFPNSEEQKLEAVREILDVELNDNWASPKTPIEIYQHCYMLTDQDVLPRHVMKVLGEMASKRSYPKLLLNKSNEGRKITYEKIEK